LSARGGVVECQLVVGEKGTVVRLTGTAVTAVSGTLFL